VLEAARASLTWLRVDAELAELLADSASASRAVRSQHPLQSGRAARLTTMSVPTNSQATPAAVAAPASKREVAVWTVVVLAASLFVYPGLSIVIAIVLAFTRLRHNPLARWVLLGVAVAVLVVQIVGLMAGPVSGSSSPGVPA
jgi:hypothetical protein